MQLKLLKAARTPDDIPFVEMGDGIMRCELDIHHIVGFECEDGNFDIENNEENREILRLIMRGESMQTRKLIEAFKDLKFKTRMDLSRMGSETAYVLEVYDDTDFVVAIFDWGNKITFSLEDGVSEIGNDKSIKLVKILYELVIKEN